AGVGGGDPAHLRKMRVWVGVTRPPIRTTREAAAHPRPTRVGELRVNYGRGCSRRVADPAPNVPTRCYPDFPPPGWEWRGGRGSPTPTHTRRSWWGPDAPPRTLMTEDDT